MDAKEERHKKKRTKTKPDRELFMSKEELEEGDPTPVSETVSKRTPADEPAESVRVPAPKKPLPNSLELYYSVDHRKGACEITGSTILVGARAPHEAVDMVLAACNTYLSDGKCAPQSEDVWDVDQESYTGDVFSDDEGDGFYDGHYAASCERMTVSVLARKPAPVADKPAPNEFHLVSVVSSYAHAFVIDDTVEGVACAERTQAQAYDDEDAHDPDVQMNVYVALDNQSEYGSLRQVCVAVADTPAQARALLAKALGSQSSADALELLMLRRDAEPFVFVSSHERAPLPVGDALVCMSSDVLAKAGSKRQRSSTTVLEHGQMQFMDDAQLLASKHVRQEIVVQ